MYFRLHPELSISKSLTLLRNEINENHKGEHLFGILRRHQHGYHSELRDCVAENNIIKHIAFRDYKKLSSNIEMQVLGKSFFEILNLGKVYITCTFTSSQVMLGHCSLTQNNTGTGYFMYASMRKRNVFILWVLEVKYVIAYGHQSQSFNI